MDSPNISSLASGTVQVPESPRSRSRVWRWVIFGVVGIGLGMVAWRLISGKAPTEGFISRTVPDLAGLDTPVMTTDNVCLGRYWVTPAGRDTNARQHYALIMELKKSIQDEAALARKLAERSCEDESLAILDVVRETLGVSVDSGTLTTVYANPKGRLFLEF